jgi:hypothetical protein
MIARLQEVTTEDPVGFVWKSLRFFLDRDFVAGRIAAAHPGVSASNPNVRKQAEQLGHCIRQGEEYFRASAQVGLATRPVLLYYGAVSLARALILLRKDGNHSFDGQRKSGKHRHHGLELGDSFRNVKADASPEQFFDSLEVICHAQGGTPWGQFPVFYDSLQPDTYIVEIQGHLEDSPGWRSEAREPRACCPDAPAIGVLPDRRWSALGLMKALPDLFETMVQSGMRSYLVRGLTRIERSVRGGVLLGENKVTVTCLGATPEDLKTLFPKWKGKQPGGRVEADAGPDVVITWGAEPGNYLPQGAWLPPCVGSIPGKNYYLTKEEEYLPEPASLYALLFAFGMLCRYHADIWMRAVERQVHTAEIIDALLNVCFRKFPNLILNQLTDTHHSVFIYIRG